MDKDKKYCINCGKEIPKTATFCPYCSAWQEDALPAPENTEGKTGSDSQEETGSYIEDKDSPLEATYSLGGSGKKIQKKELTEKYKEDPAKAEQRDAQKIKDLEEKAYRDELTHLYNRQKLREDKEKIKTNDVCAVISIDINNLKHTNDTYGHEKGDQLINNMARVLRQLVPDNCYRTGGDEFLILLPGGTKDSAEKLMQNITSLLDEMRENPDNGFVPVAAMGVAEKKSGEEYDQAFQTADKLMYENKAQLKAKRGRRSTDRIQRAADEARKNTSDSVMTEAGEKDVAALDGGITTRGLANSVRRSQEKALEQEMNEQYRSRKTKYNRMVASRTGETIFFGIILIILIIIRAHIG